MEFYHYCFARKLSIIADHKPLVAIFKKEVATLSQRIQWILIRMHQYRVRIIYKPGLDLFIADWLSTKNNTENKEAEIPGIQLNIATIQVNHKHSRLTINDTRSYFLNEQNQNSSKPQAFAQFTYHGFFKCEGKCYPNTQLELCWKILFFTIFY